MSSQIRLHRDDRCGYLGQLRRSVGSNPRVRGGHAKVEGLVDRGGEKGRGGFGRPDAAHILL